MTFNLTLQQEVFFCGVVAGKDFPQAGFNFIRRDIGKKAKFATVDPKYRHTKRRHHSSSTQNIPITTHRNQQIAAGTHLFQTGNSPVVATKRSSRHLLNNNLNALREQKLFNR